MLALRGVALRPALQVGRPSSACLAAGAACAVARFSALGSPRPVTFASSTWKAPVLRALPLRWMSTSAAEPITAASADVTKPAAKTTAKKKAASASQKKKTAKKPTSKKSTESLGEIDALHAEPGEDAEEVAAQSAAASEISSGSVEESKATAPDAAPPKKRVSPPKLAGTGSGGRVTKQDIHKSAEVFETYLRLATYASSRAFPLMCLTCR
jgi:hypothetical protein